MPDIHRDQFFITLFNTRNRVRFAMDEAFRPLGVTDATWRTLFYLEQTGSGVLQRELAAVMGIEGPSLVRLLDSLEAKDLIERKTSAADRRAKAVHLTPRADSLLDTLHGVAARVREEILSEISDAQIEECMNVFDSILSAADRRLEQQ